MRSSEVHQGRKMESSEDRGKENRLKRDEEEFLRQKKFNQFDVIENDDRLALHFDEDHRVGQEDFRTQKIMEEWRILKKGLPPTIFVRAYKGHYDFLRAVIVGGKSMPYCHGLFFFDINFPSSYPNKPPVVTYRSCGFRLHPNLELDGKVCLSLLDTSKKESEKEWNKDLSKSNVLEVLLSIQERILNSKPYFDKPNKRTLPVPLPSWLYDEKKMKEEKSKAYNEGIFALNCQTMLKIMLKPPKDFEFFVAQCFRDRDRAKAILHACPGDIYPKFYQAFLKDESLSSVLENFQSPSLLELQKAKGKKAKKNQDVKDSKAKTNQDVKGSKAKTNQDVKESKMKKNQRVNDLRYLHRSETVIPDEEYEEELRAHKVRL
ncbi:hypothetical protein MKW94_016605 [Papaver nudicaule]|uniref:UBC core domain-containing protein n=1 Tax=Papaver nudicaule TaxID=74823 RepID=A0AA41V8Q9_PAPNU|nr:hypothetical protein [Papaver nudicaule]